MKIKKKYKGSMLAAAIITTILYIFLASSFVIIATGGFGMLAASRTAHQAQQYAEIDINRLKNIAYEELDVYGVIPRQAMTNIADPGWEHEVTISEESEIVGSTAKQRIATVYIFKTGDTLPRYTLEMPISSENGALPIGSVIAWPADAAPKTAGIWLECNGQAVPSEYVALGKLMSHVPDYRGYFLRGLGGNSAALGVKQEDAIRNITGYVGMFQFVDGAHCRRAGAFDWNGTWGDSHYWGMSHHLSPIDFFRYRLVGDKASGYTLEEYIERRNVDTWKYEWGNGSSMAAILGSAGFNDGEATREITFDASKDPDVKIAVENRPLNKSVRYYIKAR